MAFRDRFGEEPVSQMRMIETHAVCWRKPLMLREELHTVAMVLSASCWRWTWGAQGLTTQWLPFEKCKPLQTEKKSS